METGIIIKIAAVGIIVAILCQVLKHSGREEYAYLVGLAALIIVLRWLLPYIYDMFLTIQNLFEL